MKHSPLQLQRYLVTDISCSANQNYNPEAEWAGAMENFTVESTAVRLEDQPKTSSHSWSVEMVITQKSQKDQNFPYRFHVNLVGVFAFSEGARNAEEENQFVRVNGSSMLYGIAREVIRSLTAAGPWGAVILPTISFYGDASQKQVQADPDAK